MTHPELRALVFLACGEDQEAQRAAAAGPIRRDYMYDVRWALRGQCGIATGDRATVDATYEALRPFEQLVAGGLTDNIVLGPVATTLGDLARNRGEVAAAAQHYAVAITIGQQAGAAGWVRAARLGLEALDRDLRPRA